MSDEHTTTTLGAGRARSANQIGLLLVDDEPVVLALYRRGDGGAGEVVAWVVLLPHGDAILLPTDDPHGHSIRTTLDNVRRRWVDLMDAELVQVAGRRALNLAA